jgi:DNA-binding transcriptional LysR family regulator
VTDCAGLVELSPRSAPVSETIDLNDVSTFVSVADAQSFTAAAKQLGVPKSTVSRRVSHLEETLGVRLLHRTTRKLALTDAGVAYFAKAQEALAGLRDAATEISEIQGAPRGTLRVTAPVDVGVAVLARIVTGFVAKYPEVRVDASLTSRTVDLVSEGFDVAIRAGKLADSSLVARKMGELSLWLLASPAYLDRRGRPRTVEDLATHECLLFRSKNGTSRWGLTGPEGDVSVDVTGSIAGDDFLYLREIMVDGGGIGLFPWFVCGEEIATRKVVRVLPDFAVRGSQLSLVYPSSRHLAPKVAAFRDHVFEAMKEPPWSKCEKMLRAAPR